MKAKLSLVGLIDMFAVCSGAFVALLLSVLCGAAFSFPCVSLMQNVWLNLACLILRKAEGIMDSHIAFSSHTVGS